MKVLFGINNDDTVKGIAEFFEKKYGEKIEYKNVYFFKQFIAELSSGEYDRAVMLEELEKFPTNNQAQIDEYLFKIIDSMTDVYDSKSIVYLASDRRKLGDEFLSKLFNLGMYTVLTGQDRTKGKVCDAINKPYFKKDIKRYYDNISDENVYKTAEVSEIEIQRIISYYQNQNGVTDKYNEIFDRIAAQYTDEQLKVIINFLPVDVKQHLAFNNEKYKEIVGKQELVQTPNVEVPEEKPNRHARDRHDRHPEKPVQQVQVQPQIQVQPQVEVQPQVQVQPQVEVVEQNQEPKQEVKLFRQTDANSQDNQQAVQVNVQAPSVQIQPQAQPVQVQKPKEILDKQKDANAVEITREPEIVEKIVVQRVPSEPRVVTQVLEKEVVKNIYEVPKDYKKVVAFVGAPKVGTTFCINAIGTYLARNKVKTAIVDITRKRDSYTIYTYDSEGKRNIAAESMRYASNGLNEPLIYEKLSVYTSMPGEDRKTYNSGMLVDTIMQHNNVILMDTDFTTPSDYFRLCQEIYVVQDMDILNINQLTIFLRQIKARGVPMNKIRIIINKHVNCVLTAKDILDGIATYTSYDLKMFDELFNSNSIPYFILPFSEENYKKYIEMVFKYTNKFNTFTDDFKENLGKIINSIYPIGNVTTTTKTYSTNKRSKIFGK